MFLQSTTVVVEHANVWAEAVVAGGAAGGFAMLVWCLQAVISFWVRRQRARDYILALINSQLEEMSQWVEMVRIQLSQLEPPNYPPMTALRHHTAEQAEHREARLAGSMLLPPQETRRYTRLIDAFDALEVLLTAFFSEVDHVVAAPREQATTPHHLAHAKLEGARLMNLFDSFPKGPVRSLTALPEWYPRLYPVGLLKGQQIDEALTELNAQGPAGSRTESPAPR